MIHRYFNIIKHPFLGENATSHTAAYRRRMPWSAVIRTAIKVVSRRYNALKS